MDLVANRKAKRSKLSRKWYPLGGLALFAIASFAQNAPAQKLVATPLGVQIVLNGNEPELRIGGIPFFVHAARRESPLPGSPNGLGRLDAERGRGHE